MRFVRDNLATIVCGAVILALVVASTFLVVSVRQPKDAELLLRIHDATGAVRDYPLGTDTTIEVRTDKGANTIVIDDGHAFVSSADCATLDCMRQRPISAPGEQIICLPHELWCEVCASGEQGQASMDTGAVSYPSDSDVDFVTR